MVEARTKVPKSTQVLLFLRGRIFFSAYPGRYGGSSVCLCLD
eukprot:SAG11_NODE_39813_length_220_cov_18.917355_1_plen_41_part_10